MLRHWFSLVVLLVLSVAMGCSERGPRTYPVRGTVTYDGQPIADGDILFVPEDASLGPEGGKILAGNFQLVSKAGKCKVQISVLDIGPDTEWVMGSPIAANYIPRIYNEETTLTAEVVAGGANEFSFDLQKPQ